MHFTHVDNLAGIAQAGGLFADRVIRSNNTPIQECGDRDIKARRRDMKVTVPPGGVVGDYVPFYFAPRSPMLYKISCGGVLTYPHGQEPLVYLVSSLNIVSGAGLPWVGSDGNTAASVTQHTNDWSTLDGIVDWPLMGAIRWNNTDDDGDRMRRRMAELLVHQFFPLELFTQIVAKSPKILQIASSHLGDRIVNGQVLPGWYY